MYDKREIISRLEKHIIMIKKVVGIYFSPVGGTAAMTKKLTEEIASRLDVCSPEGIEKKSVDLLHMRDGEDIVLDEECVAVLGMPVYVGKVPLPGIRAMKRIRSKGAVTALAVSYGGRSYGNALYELQHFAEDQDFRIIGAGAFAVRNRSHRSAGGGSTVDEEALERFGTAAAAKISRLAGSEIEGLRVKPAPVEVDGRMPVHRISRVSPRAAAMAQKMIEKLSIRRRESEWYL